MNYIKQYMMLVLVAPMAVQAEYWSKKDGITIRSAAYFQDEQVIKTDYATVTGNGFTSKGMKPVWIEITNDSDHAVAISSSSMNVPSYKKADLQKKFRYRAVLYPLLGWLGSNSVINSLFFHIYITKPMNQEINQAISLVPDIVAAYDQKASDAQTRQTNGQGTSEDFAFLIMYEMGRILEQGEYDDNIAQARQQVLRKYVPWSLGSVVLWLATTGLAIGSWWSLSSFNKEFDEKINALLLTDMLNIMPGSTVKKLVVLDAGKKVESFVFNIRDLVSYGTQIQFDIVL